MNDNRPVQLDLNLSEVNQILEALGQLPYIQVYQLIGKIQHQAQAQLHQPMLQESQNNREANSVIGM